MTKAHKLTKKSVNKLYKDLSNRSNEKDIENAWRYFFGAYYNSGSDHDLVVTSPHDTDGYLEVDSGILFFLRILMEFKENTDLNKVSDRVRITVQCIHYLKKFKESGEPLPNVIVGADENQAFVLYAPNFYDYLERDYPWDIAPSSAWKHDTKMTRDLLKDNNLSVWVYNLNDITPSERQKNLQGLFDEISELTNGQGQEYKVKVSESNVAGLFSEFRRIGFIRPDDVSPMAAVNIFMQTMVGNSDEYYLKPTSPNQLHTDNGYVTVNGAAIQAFFKHFDRNLKPADKDALFAMADRLIEDDRRREKGDFWTPTMWANRADEMLREVVGDDYKQKSVVWDCAAGTKNLTRDFNYKELYSSTLFPGEISMGSKYNPEAVTFQYDFLNDDVDLNPNDNPDPREWKLPTNLFNALRNNHLTREPIVFYTNPPYGTSGKIKKDGTSKTNMGKTAINQYMKANSWGRAGQQLYAQFYARIFKLINDFNLTNVYIAFFNNTRSYSGGEYWKQFNNKLFGNFELAKANMFNAGEFSDTADTWPITFSIFKLREAPDAGKVDTVKLSVEESGHGSDMMPIIKQLGIKTMNQVYKEQALSEWIKEPLRGKKFVLMNAENYPKLSSAMGESKQNRPTGRLYEGSLGYIMNSANNVGEGLSNGGVWLGTSAAYHGHGVNIMPENFNRVVVNFAARRSIKDNWINAQDNYSRPDTTLAMYQEYENDALVYSLFDSGSNQAAYRNWKNFSNSNIPGKWINQWFWVGKNTVMKAANELGQELIYNDVRNDSDRYVYQQIQQRELSPEASRVLELSTRLWLNQLKVRQQAVIESPAASLDAWDAGWYQMKVMNRLFPDPAMSDLQASIKRLKQKLASNTYKLGMLAN